MYRSVKCTKGYCVQKCVVYRRVQFIEVCTLCRIVQCNRSVQCREVYCVQKCTVYRRVQSTEVYRIVPLLNADSQHLSSQPVPDGVRRCYAVLLRHTASWALLVSGNDSRTSSCVNEGMFEVFFFNTGTRLYKQVRA